MTTRYVTKELTKLTTPYTLVVVNVAAPREDSQRLADACGLCLVDDGQKVAEECSRGYVIWDEENLGYARGNNKGVRFLNTIGTFTHYLFSNDDIEIKEPDILDVLADSMEAHADVACIGPRIIGIDGHDQSPHDRYISPYRLIGWKLFPWIRKKRQQSVMPPNEMPSSRYTYWVCGAFMMVEAASFLKVQMFDEATFLYFEEVILSERFLRIGKRVFFDSLVAVVHYEGGSSEKSNALKHKQEMKSRTHYLKHYKHVNSLMVSLCNKIY
jgi:GT2 family glycosyltransferase